MWPGGGAVSLAPALRFGGGKIPWTRSIRITLAFLEEKQRQMGDWWFRQEYLCEFVAATDQVFADDRVMGALSDDVAPLFPVAGP